MAWYYDNTRIFVQEANDTRSQIIPRLQPLAAGTILQFFGYEDEVKTINGFVVGSGDKSHLESLLMSGASFELTSPEGSLGNYYPKSINFNRVMVVTHTLRPDLGCDAPLYRAEIQLYKDTA